jgi:CBS domain-containing protein
MQVKDGMNPDVLTVGPTHTLREVSRQMAHRHVGAAVVVDPERAGVSILTERDVLESVAAGQDPDVEIAANHQTDNLVFAALDWSMDDAAAAMVHGNFRHLVVLESGEIVGILAMRDIVRSWVSAQVATG